MRMIGLDMSELFRMVKVRRINTITCLVICCILLIPVYNIIGLIYYYRDYLFILKPDPPLPMMRRSKDNVIINDKSKTSLPGDNVVSSSPRILCLILTSPKYHDLRASHVAATWSRHCTQAVFLTTERDVRLSHIVLTPGASSYSQLWGKVTQGFEYAYEHREKFDWVYKADDDTFAVIENLQAALSNLDPERPQATGNMLTTWGTRSMYLNGGAGYALSRSAVTKLVEEGLRKKTCSQNLELGTNEDVNMADCLNFLGVEFLDSRDALGRQRFNIYPPQELVDPRQANTLSHLWLKKVSYFPYKFGYSELSDEVISFHYVDGPTMYLLYYLIYFVNPVNSDRLQPHTFRKLTQVSDKLPSIPKR